MQIETVLWIILAAIFALSLALFQYYYKTKRRDKLIVLLSFFRFLGVFGILLLVINLKFVKKEYSVVKPKLVLLVDNSSSIKNADAGASATRVLKEFNKNTSLKDRFTISQYNFGEGLSEFNDSLTFSDKNTNIGAALKSVKDIYRGGNTAIVLLTDGNQTLGEDYEFFGNTSKFPVFPVVLGDTTRYEDLKITQINRNKYAFLKNKYPLEVHVSYEGKKTVQAVLTVSENGKTIYRKNLNFTATDNSKVIETNITATSVGIKKLKATISVLENEKNTVNNSKTVALEVIDEKTNIAIVSAIAHPDIGALKKAIESNEQRSVHVLKPTSNAKAWEDIDLFILYQPILSFQNIFKYCNMARKNSLVITGTKTDWRFLNTVQSEYVFEEGYPVQEVIPLLNATFSKFDLSDFEVTDFPPLQSNLSPLITIKADEVILNTSIRGIQIETPLLTVSESENSKAGFLFGEDLWKWRMQSFRNQQNFKKFDAFIGKLMLYLVSTKQKNRFILDYEQIYLGQNEAIIKASVFDEAFVFDGNATIDLKIKGKDNSVNKEVSMLMNALSYEADLSDLPAGDYNFTARVKNTNNVKSGAFSILEYDVEQQFLFSNELKLNRLATSTNGELYYPNEINKLNKVLLEENRFTPVQQSKENVVSLVEFKILLALILLAFAIEWFLRKFNGLT
ncbi:VWA domain-containing protein [Cellulophaga sp. F20128]|uniref:vWA domain-containing protein n=1 Tax=Cellulophaga sp. F20128 TaxID=2926413 RepID=UPI001FF4B4EF|nr:vWA domain-containing protein [Cellulophaga sp. F20128]MCK0157873.1 VWA domain-containing protein [Cellulophaga sp. F20128]